MAVKLFDYQLEALRNLRNGSILCGGVGSGKSITALAYYIYYECEGDFARIDERWNEVLPFLHSRIEEMEAPRDLYIITTAKKRDSLEWHKECSKFTLSTDLESCVYGVKVVIDSWNNIHKYKKVTGAFFIFDEQRVVGRGSWVKSFLDLTRKNHWILLSATPGDTWSDYIPVFIANGFYKNRTEFNEKHCVFSRFSKYPKIERYIGERILKEHRDSILVSMKDNRLTERHYEHMLVEYDKDKYKQIFRDRWNPYENEPIEESGKWIYLLRKVVNSDESRIKKVDEILGIRKRVIIFYNFVYELEMIKSYLDSIFYFYAEWNGHKHEDVPEGNEWAYLVQYSAGCEGWNCVATNTIIFFSQNYSYRITEQAAGRIDRINTPYKDLYYYVIRSTAPIDMAIYEKLKHKQKFNESSFKRRWNNM